MKKIYKDSSNNFELTFFQINSARCIFELVLFQTNVLTFESRILLKVQKVLTFQGDFQFGNKIILLMKLNLHFKILIYIINNELILAQSKRKVRFF